MTITQTVDIPESRRIYLDLPQEMPIGKARISIFPVTEELKMDTSLLSMRGSCKGLDTLEAYFARKRANKALEDRKAEYD